MGRTAIEKSGKTKKITGNFNLKVSMPNVDRPNFFCLETQNNLKENKTTSRNKINIHIQKIFSIIMCSKK